MSDDRRFEVAVIGGGPAGSATAIALARSGRRVALIDRTNDEAFKVGEGLPPAARPLLRELGVMDRFTADGHLPSYGNQSAWGSSSLMSADFIRDPNGSGWHLNRPRFDAMLRDAAREAGAEIHVATRLTQWEREKADGWWLYIEGEAGRQQMYCEWLIDCTGRRGSVAVNRGAKRMSYDRLISFAALFHPLDMASVKDCDSLTLIESAPDGWWYTALLPDSRRVVVYLTDADLDTGKLARHADGYLALLEQTEHVRARLAGYAPDGQPTAISANSARLDRFIGEGWIAAGDAAVSFDPLSSQGIMTALYSGLKAARALDARMSGDGGALESYDLRIGSVYDAYLRNRKVFYGYERRWYQDPFWRRRLA